MCQDFDQVSHKKQRDSANVSKLRHRANGELKSDVGDGGCINQQQNPSELQLLPLTRICGTEDEKDTVGETQETPRDDTNAEKKCRERVTDVRMGLRETKEKALKCKQGKVGDPKNIENHDDRGVS
jgi:hypothetical protein